MSIHHIGIIASSRAGSPTGANDFMVTVPLAMVGADVTNFPVMLDLSLMPSGFWVDVRSDGGNIRAYAEDGTTLIPHDLTYFDPVRQLGRLYVKTGLTLFSGVRFRVKILGPSDTMLPVGDANGRNAVWADYEVVWGFPSDVNRTGNAFTQVMTSLKAQSDWIEHRYRSLTGAPNQGIACDAGTNYVSISTDTLRKMNSAFTVTVTNASALTATGIGTVTRFGDGFISGGEIYVPAMKASAPWTSQHICVFNLSDLTFNRSYDISAQAHEVGAMCCDGTTIYAMASGAGETLVYKYSLVGAYLGTITLSAAVSSVQGMEYVAGKLYIQVAADDVYEVEIGGTNNGVVLTEFHTGSGSGLAWDGTYLHYMDTEGDLISYSKDEARGGFRRLHFDSVYATLPRSTTWSMGTHKWETAPGIQHSILSLANGATSANRATLAWRLSTLSMNLWNSTDSWIDPTPAYNPPMGSALAAAAKHNGTTERKIHVQALLADTDATISARPAGAGTDMDFVVNASDTSNSENGKGYFELAWLRNDYVSDAFINADQNNYLNPSKFCQVDDFGSETTRIHVVNVINRVNTTSTLTFTDPGLMAVDDLMIVVMSHGGTGTAPATTGPVGWTKEDQTEASRANASFFWKRAELADLLASPAFVGQPDAAGTMIVLRNVPLSSFLTWAKSNLSVNATSAPLANATSTVANSVQIASYHGGWGGDYVLTHPDGMVELYDINSGTLSEAGVNFGCAIRHLGSPQTIAGTWNISTGLHYVTYNIIISGNG